MPPSSFWILASPLLSKVYIHSVISKIVWFFFLDQWRYWALLVDFIGCIFVGMKLGMEARRLCSRKKLASGRGRAESGRTCTSTAPARRWCLTASSFSGAGAAIHTIVEVLSFSVEKRVHRWRFGARNDWPRNTGAPLITTTEQFYPEFLRLGRLTVADYFSWFDFFGGSAQRAHHARSLAHGSSVGPRARGVVLGPSCVVALSEVFVLVVCLLVLLFRCWSCVSLPLSAQQF